MNTFQFEYYYKNFEVVSEQVSSFIFSNMQAKVSILNGFIIQLIVSTNMQFIFSSSSCDVYIDETIQNIKNISIKYSQCGCCGFKNKSSAINFLNCIEDNGFIFTLAKRHCFRFFIYLIIIVFI